MTEKLLPADKGRIERERLAPVRAKNYAVKVATGFRCDHEGCDEDSRLLVTEDFDVLCPAHLGEATVRPGQWNDQTFPVASST